MSTVPRRALALYARLYAHNPGAERTEAEKLVTEKPRAATVSRRSLSKCRILTTPDHSTTMKTINTMKTHATAIDTSLFSIRVELDQDGEDLFLPLIDVFHSLGMRTPEEVPAELRSAGGPDWDLKKVFETGTGDGALLINAECMAIMLTVDYMSETSVALWQWFEAVYVEGADQGAPVGTLQ